MTISEEAVQAAHAAICEDNLEDCLEWRGRCVKAVEAAAPYLVKVASSEGYQDGYSKGYQSGYAEGVAKTNGYDAGYNHGFVKGVDHVSGNA